MDTIEVKPADLNETAAPTLQDRGGYTIEYKHFAAGSSAEGFGYNVIQYTSVDKLREKLGDEAILALANSAIVSSLRVKAKGKLPEANPEIKDEKERAETLNKAVAALKESTGGVLLSEDEAAAFVPGSREKTSVATLMREAKEAKEAGNIDLSKQLYKRALEQLQAQALAQVGTLDDEDKA